MEKLTKGRKKIEMKKIEDEDARFVTFSKRKSGIFKKASELAILCGIQFAIIVFSPTGKPFSIGNPDVETIINRFLNGGSTSFGSVGTGEHGLVRDNLNELIQKFIDLKTRVDMGKIKAKQLKEMKKKRLDKYWWAKPVEELSLGQLQQLNYMMEVMKNQLAARRAELLNSMNAVSSMESSGMNLMNSIGAFNTISSTSKTNVAIVNTDYECGFDNNFGERSFQ